MYNINIETKETLTKALLAYYQTLSDGDLTTLAALMTKDSYITLLTALGFKRSFKDPEFRELLKTSSNSDAALSIVEAVLSDDLKQEKQQHRIELLSFEPKGRDRITVNYQEDGHLKKVYFAKHNEQWHIDYNAGRKTA